MGEIKSTLEGLPDGFKVLDDSVPSHHDLTVTRQ